MLTEVLLGAALAALFTTLGVPSVVLRAVRGRGLLTVLLCTSAGARQPGESSFARRWCCVLRAHAHEGRKGTGFALTNAYPW
jgi:hypothetical protein